MQHIVKFIGLAIITIAGFFLVKYASFEANQPVSFNDFQPSLQSELQSVSYAKDVKPVLAQRCVVCHACYDAPCQLKLGSYEGIQRGANKARVYDGERLIEANLTRLFEDAHSTQAWREKEFFPVVSDTPIHKAETASQQKENLTQSVMAEMLALKKQYPLPETVLLPEQFELDLNREYQCPNSDSIHDYKEDSPLLGMPYALPQLPENEHQLLTHWIAQGAQGNDEVNLTEEIQEKVAHWETFLNQPDLKSQLMSRYLFEHLFLVNLFFKEQPKQYFKLVRSATAPGKSVKGIYTRRPFDDPQTSRVYYRLVPVINTIVHKSHMPLSLSNERLEKWRDWFLTPEYQVTQLPSYEPEEASNPFITFAQIPVKSRYNYMLDESQNTIMQFIKGPVCRGQMALNVINDHFWVVFVDPDSAFVENNNHFIQQALKQIALPAEKESTALPTAWISYAAQERDYLAAKALFIKNSVKNDNHNNVPITLDLLWDGNGENENLALTVFRHNDAASVVKGLIGKEPQTAWVLTYPLFERIHYLLVAGYDVYGNVGHQLNSRMYMDFLRMEGEFNFLSFLPEKAREEVRNTWYRGSVSSVEEFVYQANTHALSTDIDYQTQDPLAELYQRMKKKLSPNMSEKHNLNKGFSDKKTLATLAKVNQLTGNGISLLPESTIVQIFNKSTGDMHFYTLLRHSAYTNISHLFGEDDRRLPNEDTVTMAKGLMTSHPNAFIRIEQQQIGAWLTQLQNMRVEADYHAMMTAFGVRRTNKNFWQFADEMHQYLEKNYPIEFGYLDFNRLENR